MWLLDENLDVSLLAFLRSQEIKCDNVRGQGWRGLQNDVTHDVPENVVVAGVPARPPRQQGVAV